MRQHPAQQHLSICVMFVGFVETLPFVLECSQSFLIDPCRARWPIPNGQGPGAGRNRLTKTSHLGEHKAKLPMQLLSVGLRLTCSQYLREVLASAYSSAMVMPLPVISGMRIAQMLRSLGLALERSSNQSARVRERDGLHR